VPCVMHGCLFEGPLTMEAVQANSLDLRGSRLGFIQAYGAHVSGRLDLTDTAIAGGGARGLNADGIVVDSALFAARMTVDGRVGLVNGTIREQFVLQDARLRNRGGIALNVGGLHVGRSLIAGGMEADGQVRMPGVRIDSALVLDGASLTNPQDVALFAESANVASDISAQGLTAQGSVMLRGGRVGGSVRLRGASLQAAGQPVLRADRMTIGGSLYLGDGFATAGEVRLTGTRVSGHLDLNGTRSADALLTLYATRVDSVREGEEPWPARLNLEGFVYRDLSPYRPARERIRLLARQVNAAGQPGGYRAQPYEQLAAYYRGLGHDEEARTVLLAKERTRRRTMPWMRRIPAWILDAAVGYGYRPLRAVGWAVGLLTFATVFFAHYRPVRVQTDDKAAYNPLLYAADQLVPLVRFGQAGVFQSRGFAAAVAAALSLIGWAFSIAIAAAVTRTLASS
jgi:hypothetical protein